MMLENTQFCVFSWFKRGLISLAAFLSAPCSADISPEEQQDPVG